MSSEPHVGTGVAPHPTPDAIAKAHPGANLQLIACAGAGKTETVSRRIVEQLALDGVRPVNVVAFTFTEKAAAELKDRVARRYEERNRTRDGLADLYVGTIHGFCLETLQQHQLELLSYRVLDDVQQRLFISRNSVKCGLKDLGWHRFHNASTYAELMAILREADVDEQLLNGSEAEACLQKYRDLLDEHRYLDFTDIISRTVELLEDPIATDFRNRISGCVQHVTVDEYQDVNPIQERLVLALAELGAKVCVVGDDDQLLYGWRGSRIDNILTFEHRYTDVAVERLERNHRSSHGIVDLARGLVTHIEGGRLPKAMISAERQPYEEGDIAVREFDEPDTEAAFIASRIEELIGTPFRDRSDAEPRGLSYSDMAILIRSRKHLIPPITRALEERDIPYVVGGVANLFDTVEVQACRQLFAYLAGEGELEDAESAWQKANLGLTDDDLNRGLSGARNDREAIETEEGRFGIYNLQRSYLDFLEAIDLREEKIEGITRAHGHERAEVVYYNLGKFSQVISDFEQIHFLSAPQRKYETFLGFLDHQAGSIYPEGWLEARYVAPDAVQIMTIHQAKGLQWPAVFVPGLTKGVFPPRAPGGRSPFSVLPDGAVRNASNYRGGDDDERRLLYVAATRPKKYLTLTRAIYPAGKISHRKVPFLWDELHEELARVPEPEPRPTLDKLPPTPERSVADVNLSFSELKIGFECPYSFKLRFLYGFNPPIAEALGFGKSLHDALFELHDRALNGGDTSVNCIDGLVDRHLFLPFAYKALNQDLTDTAKKRLGDYIEKRGATFDDIEHAERPVEIDLGDGIRVIGRIDLIRRRSTGEVVIIDFKSKERVQQEDVSNLQLRTYAIGYRQATGRDADKVVIENLDDLDRPREEPIVPDYLTAAENAIRSFAKRLRTNDLPRRPRGPDEQRRRKTCTRCDLTGICGSPFPDGP